MKNKLLRGLKWLAIGLVIGAAIYPVNSLVVCSTNIDRLTGHLIDRCVEHRSPLIFALFGW